MAFAWMRLIDREAGHTLAEAGRRSVASNPGTTRFCFPLDMHDVQSGCGDLRAVSSVIRDMWCIDM